MQRTASLSGLRSTRWAVALTLLLTTVACSGGEPSDSEAAAEAGQATAPVAADASEAAPSPETAPGSAEPSDPPSPASEPAAEASSKAAPKLTSLDGGTMSAGDLHEAYFHWNGETVTVTGYPALYTKRAKWSRRVSLGAEPEPKTPGLLGCRLNEDEVPEGRLTVDTVVTLRGKVRQAGWGRSFGDTPAVVLEDGCEVVATGGDVPSGGDPWTLGPDPIAVTALHEAMFGWQGETVRVVGYYGGTATSTPGFDPAKTRTSHGIKTDARGKGVLKCDHPGEVEAPVSVVENREGTIVEGTIGEPKGSMVILDDCRIVEG